MTATLKLVAAPTAKVCNRCQAARPHDEFHRRARARDGLSSHCKACATVAVRQYRAALPKERRSVRYEKPELLLARQLKQYKLTVEEYEHRVARQHGRCAICGLSNGSKRLVVDHDHRTGAVRGLLCTACNLGVGNLKDSKELLASAITYLERA